VFHFDGVCRTSFRKNRIGFCVLHPPELAGTPYVRETPGGHVEERFAELISPRRDIANIQALRYMAGPVSVELRFEGDLFDMEDQRNWTDASYKTFCTPLARPFPVQVAAGERIQQTVTLELRVPPNLRPQPDGAAWVEPNGAPDVVVADRSVGRLPPLGLGTAFDARPLSSGALERLRALRLAHLRVELDLRAEDGRDRLRIAQVDAAALAAELDVAIVTDTDGSRTEEVAAALRDSDVPVVRFAIFAEKRWVTTRALIERARAASVPTRVGGGSRTDFAQLNMQQASIPISDLEFVTYAINPQVHTFDDMSIMETIGTHAATVTSARALAGDRPLVIGPITLGPRFNPNATSGGGDASSGASQGPVADRRQTTAFAAAWTVGGVHQLATAGSAALTLFETVGPRGIVDVFGAPYPVYEVLAALSPHTGAELLDVRRRDPLSAEAIALRTDAGLMMLVANLTSEQRDLQVKLPTGATRSLELGPYAVARIETE